MIPTALRSGLKGDLPVCSLGETVGESRMQLRGLEPNVFTLNALLDAFAKRGRLTAAEPWDATRNCDPSLLE